MLYRKRRIAIIFAEEGVKGICLLEGKTVSEVTFIMGGMKNCYCPLPIKEFIPYIILIILVENDSGLLG